ncbi:hypothetical protein ACFOLJ_00635 [Rugamonas sp. CCM 8940]|uniref:hypothetical protein n=1 Tax=Rugamonas sp. CCM 8940 TaxID=2765359 RepID=UPI0018F58B37|nr:hypothetical protein [Rugamonas sp. CCM 8940]MBJ7308866.1 hypothetical protein [Rugamonas sp. CCM 8940]
MSSLPRTSTLLLGAALLAALLGGCRNRSTDEVPANAVPNNNTPTATPGNNVTPATPIPAPETTAPAPDTPTAPPASPPVDDKTPAPPANGK